MTTEVKINTVHNYPFYAAFGERPRFQKLEKTLSSETFDNYLSPISKVKITDSTTKTTVKFDSEIFILPQNESEIHGDVVIRRGEITLKKVGTSLRMTFSTGSNPYKLTETYIIRRVDGRRN